MHRLTQYVRSAGMMSFLKTVIGFCVVVTLLGGILGCEGGSGSDEKGGVRFENDSSHAVTVVWAATADFATPSVFTLQPGQNNEVTPEHVDEIFYDWEPKDTVNADQVHKDNVVFVDK